LRPTVAGKRVWHSTIFRQKGCSGKKGKNKGEHFCERGKRSRTPIQIISKKRNASLKRKIQGKKCTVRELRSEGESNRNKRGGGKGSSGAKEGGSYSKFMHGEKCVNWANRRREGRGFLLDKKGPLNMKRKIPSTQGLERIALRAINRAEN